MLEHITYLPLHVLGIHALGEVTNDDYENAVLPLIDEHVKQNGRINFLLVLETDIKNFTAGAWCGNVKIGLQYFTKWNKVAVVTDQAGVREFNHLFEYFIPGQFKGYSLDQLGDAVKWVSSEK